jgi:membrane associated rhomboid family serine protease
METAGPTPHPLKPKRVWLIGTPLVSLLTALALIALHAPVSTLSGDALGDLWFEFGSVPARFYAEQGSSIAYPNILALICSLVSPALVHGNWVHVLVNALMTWQFGSPVARALEPGVMGAAKWMLLFVVSVAAGSLAYLLIAGEGGVVSVGASGGTSGLIAASFLLDWENRVRSPLSRQFLILTAVFVAINVALVYLGPIALGMMISWEAHAGGYVAGAAMMLIYGRKMYAAPAA